MENMNDEEKQAIEGLKGSQKWIRQQIRLGNLPNYNQGHYTDIQIVLNLIENQSKEIEELKEKNKTQSDCAEPIERTEEMVNMKWVNYHYINKEKLKEILEIEENLSEERILSLLKTIVSENSRLEDIEDRKVQIEYNNVFNKGVKSVEDKIKAKIEEYDDKGMTINLTSRSAGKTFQQAVHYEVKKALQSLLEKE